MENLGAAEWAALISGFGGAVIGAIIGGVISWMLARQAANESRLRDKEERFAADKSAAIRTLLKVQQITNGTYTIANLLREAKVEATTKGAPNLWQVLKPHVGGKAEVKIGAEDLAPFMDNDGNTFVNEIALAALRYDVLEATLSDYSDRRSRLGELLAPYSKIDPKTGQGVTSVSDPNVIAVAEARAFELNDMLGQLGDFAETDLANTLKLCDQMTAYGLKKFGQFPKLEAPPSPATSGATLTGAPRD